MRVTLADHAANAAGLPEYHPDNLTDRISEARHPHLIWAERWIKTRGGLWHCGGYVLRRGWRMYRTRRTPA